MSLVDHPFVRVIILKDTGDKIREQNRSKLSEWTAAMFLPVQIYSSSSHSQERANESFAANSGRLLTTPPPQKKGLFYYNSSTGRRHGMRQVLFNF